MSYKFEVPGLPENWADTGGLKSKRFNGYPVSVPGSDVTPSPNPYGLSQSAWTGEYGLNTEIDFSITSSNTVYVWRGYFKPDQTSTSWQFRTNSNDGSWLWIDFDAEARTTALVTANADVKNGGQHGSVTAASSNLSLSQSSDSDIYYPIAIVAGNKPGDGNIRVEFRRDGGTWQKDGSGYYFSDSRYRDGFGADID